MLKFEHKLLKRLVSASSQSVSFSFGIAFASSFTVPDSNEAPILYNRCLESGSLIGMRERLFPAMTLFDIVMTHEDREDVIALGQRQRGNEVKDVSGAWDDMTREMCSGEWSSWIGLRAWFVMDTTTNVDVRAINLDCNELSHIADEVTMATSHDLPSFNSIRHLRMDEVATMPFSDQVRAINCFSNLNVDSKTSSSTIGGHAKDPAHVSWQTFSIRNRIAAQLSEDIFSEENLEQALRAQNQRFQPRSGKRQRTTTSSRLTSSHSTSSLVKSARQGASTHSQQLDYGNDELLPTLNFVHNMQDRTLFSQLRSALIRSGVFRILRNDGNVIQVVWNAYNPKTGALSVLRFCTTKVEMMEEQEPAFLCLNCPSFQHSTLLRPHAEVGSTDTASETSHGYCAHTKLLNALIPFLTATSRLPVLPKDAFVMWALSNACGDGVRKIHDNSGLLKFFVNVSDGAARYENTAQVAICHVFPRTDASRLSCSVGRCMEVTMKLQKKKLKTLDGLCCHLRAVFEHEHYKYLWDHGARAEGFELTSSHDMQAALDKLTGECITLTN